MNTLETEVLYTIGEDTSSPDVFTNDATGLALIRRSINDAIQEICMVTGGYRRTYFLATTASSAIYRLNWRQDYMGYVVQAWDRERKMRLKQTDAISLAYRDREFLSDSGEPDEYYQIGYTSIGLYPTPATTGRVLELDCVVIPQAYTSDTDPIKLRANYQRAVVDYAIGEYYASRGDANRATEWFLRYAEVLNLKRTTGIIDDRTWRYGGQTQVAVSQ